MVLQGFLYLRIVRLIKTLEICLADGGQLALHDFFDIIVAEAAGRTLFKPVKVRFELAPTVRVVNRNYRLGGLLELQHLLVGECLRIKIGLAACLTGSGEVEAQSLQIE